VGAWWRFGGGSRNYVEWVEAVRTSEGQIGEGVDSIRVASVIRV